jgi:hypothetical protein
MNLTLHRSIPFSTAISAKSSSTLSTLAHRASLASGRTEIERISPFD